MESVVLTIHLILAALLIGVVLMQKSEGAALLSGGGNMQARGQATALTKLTWILAAAFLTTSIVLTILATRGGVTSVVDRAPPEAVQETTGTQETTGAPAVDGGMPSGADLLPPPLPTEPAAPPSPAEPAAPPAPAADAGASPATGTATGAATGDTSRETAPETAP